MCIGQEETGGMPSVEVVERDIRNNRRPTSAAWTLDSLLGYVQSAIHAAGSIEDSWPAAYREFIHHMRLGLQVREAWLEHINQGE